MKLTIKRSPYPRRYSWAWRVRAEMSRKVLEKLLVSRSVFYREKVIL